MVTALAHARPDRIPVDFGGTGMTGIHVSAAAALRRHYGLEEKIAKGHRAWAMLGEIEPDLKQAMGIDVEGVFRLTTRFGTRQENWKPFRLDDGLEVAAWAALLNTTKDSNGDTLLYPQGDVNARPSARMPRDGYFFDNIIRQEPFDEDQLNPADNLEEFGPISSKTTRRIWRRRPGERARPAAPWPWPPAGHRSAISR